MVKKALLIYHGGCPDGKTAERVCEHFLKLRNDDIVVFSYPIFERDFSKDKFLREILEKKYSTTSINKIENDHLEVGATKDGRRVMGDELIEIDDWWHYIYILNWASFTKEELTLFKKACTDLIIIDHHASAFDTYSSFTKDLDALYVYEKSKCAASLAWGFLASGMERPLFIKHIEDRDLWKWELPQSKEFGAALYRKTFEKKNMATFNRLFRNAVNCLDDCLLFGRQEKDNSLYKDLYKKGARILKYNDEIVAKICSKAEFHEMTFDVKILSVVVAFVESPIFQSECGDYLCKTKIDPAKKTNADLPDLPDFVVIYRYSIEKEEWRVSLRGSPTTKTDLLAIAKGHGGGGHPLACGYSTKNKKPLSSFFVKIDNPPPYVEGESRTFIMSIATFKECGKIPFAKNIIVSATGDADAISYEDALSKVDEGSRVFVLGTI